MNSRAVNDGNNVPLTLEEIERSLFQRPVSGNPAMPSAVAYQTLPALPQLQGNLWSWNSPDAKIAGVSSVGPPPSLPQLHPFAQEQQSRRMPSEMGPNVMMPNPAQGHRYPAAASRPLFGQLPQQNLGVPQVSGIPPLMPPQQAAMLPGFPQGSRLSNYGAPPEMMRQQQQQQQQQQPFPYTNQEQPRHDIYGRGGYEASRFQPQFPVGSQDVPRYDPPQLVERVPELPVNKSELKARFDWEPVGTFEVRPAVASPDEYIDVSWEIPAQFVSRETLALASLAQKKNNNNNGGARDDSQQGDWIGLFRARQRIDDSGNFILTRETSGRIVFDSKAGVVRGKVRLRAPRGVGSYDFRYFLRYSTARNEGDKMDSRRFPLARSAPLTVTVQGHAILEALQFIDKNLKDKKRFSAAAQQLSTLLRQVNTLRHPLQPGIMRPEEQERKLLEETWKLVAFSIEKGVQIDESLIAETTHLRLKAEEAQKEYEEALKTEGSYQPGMLDLGVEDDGMFMDIEEGDSNNEKSPRDETVNDDKDDLSPAEIDQNTKRQTWIMIRRDLAQAERDRASVASSAKGIIDDIRGNPYLFSLLNDQRRRYLISYVQRYSCIEERFFPTEAQLREFMREELHIGKWALSEDGRLDIEASRANEMEELIEGFLPNLIPGPQFYDDRRSIIRKLQAILDQDLAPYYGACRLIPFGSSANSFGGPNSDLDLCLAFTQRNILSGDEASQAVSKVAELLQKHQYMDVDDSRKTARIPIVQFKDPTFGVECDICVNNPLAIRNTLLLRTYGSIDERARRVVFFVKEWAKRRGINNPSSHTLSSYGWILLVVNYMQRIGLLPVLQGMPVYVQGNDGNPLPILPKVMVAGADGKLHNTYFFGDPESSFFSSPESRERAAIEARRISASCQASLSSVLCGFFWDLAMNDWRRYVSSVKAGQLILKANKAAEDSWRLHPRCAIEDPFEISYDVGHVLRDSTFKKIREEACRAYALLVGCHKSHMDSPVAECLAEVLKPLES